MTEPALDDRRPLLLPWIVASLGGALGILAAAWQEMTAGAPLMVIVVAPVIEEIVKPLGVIYLIDRRARWIRSAAHVVGMCIVAAAVFATIENLVYIHVYHRGASVGFKVFRYTVCTALHVTCSAIVGFGLVRAWRKILDTGKRFDIDDCLGFFVAAVAVHGGYNLLMFLLEALKVIQFSAEATGP